MHEYNKQFNYSSKRQHSKPSTQKSNKNCSNANYLTTFSERWKCAKSQNIIA